MSTCRETVEGALRKLGKLGAGRSARTADAEDTLEALKGLYKQWIDGGTFGRLNDVIPVADYVAGENERIFRNTDDVLSITLPETIDGVEGALPPMDLSVVVIADSDSGNTLSYIYDGAIKQWTAIDGLTLDSIAPLSHRDPDGLKARLALQIADEYGGQVPPLTVQLARSFQSSLVHRYSNPVVQSRGVFV